MGLRTIGVFFVEGLGERSKACDSTSFFIRDFDHDPCSLAREGIFWTPKQGIYLNKEVSMVNQIMVIRTRRLVRHVRWNSEKKVVSSSP